ncbi:MAG: hypothetical protein IKO51_02840 [Clostridia bacterium]|nr:hypothetical protein [Clostridia bacterium]
MKNTSSKRITERLCLALAAVLLAAFLCACARGNPGGATPAPQQTPEPTADAELSPAPGGKLRMAMPENLSVGNAFYDPLIVNTEEALNLYSLVFEPLIAVDETNGLVPCLAINWSAAPHLENAWMINLREGVRWHTGAALTADDVIYTFDHLRQLGAESYYKSSVNAIESIMKLDATTLIVTMNSPGLMSLYSLNFPIIKRDISASVLVGTGAYRVTSYNDERIAMSANADWWDRPPYVQAVEFLARDSNETALASYAAGQLDLVPTALLAAGKYGDAGVTVVRDYMTQGMETMLFNHRRSLLAKNDLRRAVAMSINRTRIIANVYMNRARSCDVPVPPDSWLYNGSNRQIDYDPQGAAALLSGLGYTLHDDGLLYSGGEPLTLTLLVSSSSENTTRADAAAAIASQLAQVGVTVNVVTAAHNYGQTESEFLTLLSQMNWDIALVGFNLSVANDLAPYLTVNGANNFGAFPGEEFTPLLREARNAADEESLRSAFYALEAKFTEDLPFLVLYFRLNSLVARAELKGVAAFREPALLRNIKNWYLNEE